MVSGTYQPTNINDGGSDDVYPAPAPAPSGNTTLAAFNGIDPNGIWSLYVMDDAFGDIGSIEGWSLQIDGSPASALHRHDGPTVTIEQAGSDPTIVTPIHFTATFSEPVTGFDGTDIDFTGSDPAWTLSATVTATLDPLVYDVAVSGMTTAGTVVVSIPAAAVTDDAGNPNTASTSADNQVTLMRAQSLPGAVNMSVTWGLRNTLDSGPADISFSLGTRPLVPLAGDWNGDGIDTPAYYKNGSLFVPATVHPSLPSEEFSLLFGDSRGFPVAGDFDGDGIGDFAVFRNGTWQMRTSSESRNPDDVHVRREYVAQRHSGRG